MRLNWTAPQKLDTRVIKVQFFWGESEIYISKKHDISHKISEIKGRYLVSLVWGEV